MADVPSTTNRAVTFTLASAASTNATSIKSSGGFVYQVLVSNTVVGTASRYVKIYDKASAPTVGTDRPVLQLPVLQSSATASTGFAEVRIPDGMKFTNGIALSLNTGAADTDTGAVAANELKVVVQYK